MQPEVRIYTSSYCPFCARAEQLLLARGVTDMIRFNVDGDPAKRAEMMQITGRRTVPQIFIGDYHVGGCDDLYALDQAGSLVSMLDGSTS
ncbi:glutaredoxin 3 [Parazoarcus communis]|uniref:Glutaredoxin n=1 Tax=Parazoarcus communis TaxID=41977 RepID=A0A2U8GUJ6_9RHOO|nr:glutaredoxin 3 [Parazoarcus communis]AWI77362.1 glutaredoxin 3 [Parazoarcus communis]TVT58196.1 MAG: glutaredoxin 3 [Azoarcus sp. PHD]|tara:strand:- start:93587 stop:93856 length:270 start_codon:yes stop_codon:yes gene_type:complete